MPEQEQMIRQRGLSLLNSWREDWCRFASEALGVTLDAEQQAILRSVQFNPRTSVASGTARGKDFVAAVAAICFLYLTPRWNRNGELVENTKVALTAPTDRQVKNIMMPEISRLYNRARMRGVVLPGRLNAYDIRTDFDEWFLTGFKADENNHEAWSGFHAVNTMFVITEASGISDDTFAAIEGNLQGNSRILLVFNPNTPVGYAARSQKSGRWNRFQLNSLTAPNVIERRQVIAGQVDYEWVIDKLEQWCMPIREDEVQEEFDDFCFEGRWYRPDDLFRKKVLGKFPKVSEDILIPSQWIEAAHQRWIEAHGEEPAQAGRRVLGVDVAGMGRDCTVFCERKENYVAPFRSFNSGGTADHMEIAGKIRGERSVHPKLLVSIDTIGEGAGVFSRCVEQENSQGRQYILSCKYSEGAKNAQGKELTDLTGQHRFLNMRAYLFWAVRDWLNPKNDTGAMLPPDSQFDEEASEIRWAFRSDGKIQIEAKDEIKKRIGRSPDKFDALANTFYPIYVHKPIDLERLSRSVY
mgnify:FL=1